VPGRSGRDRRFIASTTPCTDVHLHGTVGTTGKTVDQLTVAEMVANNIRPIEKILHVDLNAVGYKRFRRSSLTLIDPRRSRSSTIMTSA
jgi:hypothetical protein